MTTSLQSLWDKSPSPRITDLVVTDGLAALLEYNKTEHAYHLHYHELDCTPENVSAIAEFVRLGLPTTVPPLKRDEDWIHCCNWPDAQQQAGQAIVYLTEEDVLGVSRQEMERALGDSVRDVDAWMERRVLDKLSDRGFYLQEAVVVSEGRVAYRLPLNLDTAARLMRKDQARFRKILDALLIDTAPKDRAWPQETDSLKMELANKALRQLSHVANRIIQCRLHAEFWPDGRAEFHTLSRGGNMLTYLPNSVTWAWSRLIDAVTKYQTYRRCADTRCAKLFGPGQPNQTYCSPSCADAHRQLRYRQRQKSRQAYG